MLDKAAGTVPGRFAVLTYHRVAPPASRPWLYPGLLSATPAQFAEQMEMLRRQFRPISMHELLAAHRGSTVLPPRAVLVTVDDGYMDFAEYGWPVLRRLDIPVTLFVPTAFPGRDASGFWWDDLWSAVRSMPAGAKVETTCGVLTGVPVEQRVEEARRLIECHKQMLHSDVLASVDSICEGSRTADGDRGVLNWQELRRLAAEGVTLAPHTRNHPLLTRVPDEVLQAELASSRDDLHRYVEEDGSVLGNIIAYPAGAHSDHVRQAASANDFELGFTTERGVNLLGQTDPLRLKRINVGRRSESDLIRTQIVLGLVRSRLGRA
jgi:peptidoglycan/xylan/chitin deacetylase (PgdA/CDA1 family)